MVNDFVLFAVLPYAALVVGLLILLRNALRAGGAEVGSPAAEPVWFESSVSWRWGVGGLLVGHLAGFLVPAQILAWNRVPLRLLVLEGVAFAFGGLAILGLILGAAAAAGSRPEGQRGATGVADTVALTTLAAVLASGIFVAFTERWGSSWYAAVMVPYLRSLLILDPAVGSLVGLPFSARLHLLSALLLPAVLAPAGAGRGFARRLRTLGSRVVSRTTTMSPAETA